MRWKRVMICISWAQATASNLLPVVFGAAALLAALVAWLQHQLLRAMSVVIEVIM